MSKSGACCALIVLSAASFATAGPVPRYAQVATWPAAASAWDYASVDPAARRLYVGRFGGVLSADLATGRITPVLVASKLVHGVAPLPHGLAAASNGEADTVTVFDGATGVVRATIAVGKGPDSIAYDPSSGLVAVTDEEGQAVSLVDPLKGVRVGDIALGGSPEAVVADGRGRLYDNIDSRAEIAVLSVASRKVERRIALPGCDRPTGLAYDPIRRLLVSTCRNGMTYVVKPDGRIVTTLKLGAGPDDVMIDPRRGVAFVPSGATGLLSVLALDAGGNARVTQSVVTAPGVRIGAVDPRTGYLYLPTADLLPSTEPGVMHKLRPGSFKILVYAPQ